MGENRVKNGVKMVQNRSKWVEIGSKWVKMGQKSPFWTLFGASGAPKGRGEPAKSGQKGGSKGHKNVFWDRFIPFGCHFTAFRAETENHFFSILRPFWAILGPFLGPFGASGALKGRGEPAKSGQKGVKRP